MARKPALKVVKGLDAIADRWMRLRHEIAERKRELEELEPPLKEALRKAPNRERQFGPHLLMLTNDSTRVNFDRARAIAELGSETLAPFLKEAHVDGYIRPK